MQKSEKLLETMGQLVVPTPSLTMDQTELSQRVGVGRNTISSIEKGKPVDAETLFNVFEHLDIIEDLQFAVEQKLDTQNSRLSRKSRKERPQLENDF